MKVYEILYKVYLLEDISLKEVQREIFRIIDITLGKSEDTLRLHNKNDFKNYCFNSFYPIEKDGVYKEGNIYTITIRTIDKSLMTYFSKNLPFAYTTRIRGLKTQLKVLPKKKIRKIYSITPVIIKNDQGYWRGIMEKEEYMKRIKENLIKKYNGFLKTEINEEFEVFKSFEFKNNKPISNNYKGKNLLGDKISIEIEDNVQAQDIIYMSLGTGVGEMNARGLGFMGYRWE